MRAQEQLLRESQARFRAVSDGSPLGIFVTDSNLDCVYVNPAYLRLSGRMAEAALGKGWVEAIHPEDRPQDIAAWSAALQRKGAHEQALRLQQPNGDSVWVLMNVAETSEGAGRFGFIGQIEDLSPQRQVETAPWESEKRMALHIERTPLGVIEWDLAFRIRKWNPAAARIFGYSATEAIGQSGLELLVPRGQQLKIKRSWDAMLQNHGRLNSTHENITRDGRTIRCEWYNAPLIDAQGAVVGAASLVHDATQRKLAEEALYAEKARAQVTLESIADAVITTDGNGVVTYLNPVAEALTGWKSAEAAGHLLHEVFVTVDDATHEPTENLAVRVLEDDSRIKLRADTVLLHRVDGEFAIEESAASIRDHEGEILGLVVVFRDVTEARRMAKQLSWQDSGRNRVQLHHAADDLLAQRHSEMEWVSRLHRALDENRFCLYYQEIAPIGGNPATGDHHEVLLRMIDEQGQLVPPMAFIPAAERYDLMPALDRWTIRTAFKHYRERYPAEGEQSLYALSINLSGVSFTDEHFLDFVRDQFAEHGLAPERVCFEITETAAIANLAKATAFIQALKQIGCRFSLDDFGSGMSSFGYLNHLPVDYLKIDGSFVKDMENDPIDRAMVEAINNIGHVMGIKTIAEFVENEQILARLEAMKVDYAQGYGIAKPRPLEDLAITRRREHLIVG